MLRIRNLAAGYRGRTVLRDVSLDVNRGELLGIVGSNGVGKTTLLRSIMQLHPSTATSVTWNAIELKSHRRRKLSQLIAYMPQASADAWPLTVREFVTLGRLPHLGWKPTLSTADRTAVEQALHLTCTAEYASRIMSTLSGGERQRVRLARAIAQEPELLLLDEPTAHLDLRHQRDLFLCMRHLMMTSNITVIVTIHDVNLAALYVDRLAILDDGIMTHVGTPADVLASTALETAYGMSFAYATHPATGRPWIVPKPQ